MSLIPDDEIPTLEEDAPFVANLSLLNRVFAIFQEFFNTKMDATNLSGVASLNPDRVVGTAMTLSDITDAPGKNPGKAIVPKGGTFTVVDASSQISNAKLTGTAVSNTDNGTLYGKITKVGSDHIVDLYNDSGRTTKVATGMSTSATTTITLAEVSVSGVNGTIDIAYTADNALWTVTSDLKNGQVDMTGIKFIYQREDT